MAVATWYPITDYKLTRAERRASSVRLDLTLPSMMTDLFDAAYLWPPHMDVTDPLLSPSRASDELLAEGVPPHVMFYTCEWDMLLREGEELAKRLARAPIQKQVFYKMIPGVVHGWDKGPHPHKLAKLYRECCEKLREVFDSD